MIPLLWTISPDNPTTRPGGAHPPWTLYSRLMAQNHNSLFTRVSQKQGELLEVRGRCAPFALPARTPEG